MDERKVALEIDISRLLECPACAVHLRTEEEAIAIIRAAKNLYPERVRAWDVESNNWSDYRDQTAFTFFDEPYHEEPNNMTYADVPWFRENGYEIVEFSDLRLIPDIDESDMSISFLVGGSA